MSFGDTSSTMIFFITSTVVATVVAGGLTTAVMSFSGKIDVKGKALGESLTTDITIINDPKSVTTSPNLLIYVKNTGSRTLDKSLLNVLVDGQYATWTSAFAGGATAWGQGNVTTLTISAPAIAVGDHSVRVVTDYGRAADFKFNRPS